MTRGMEGMGNGRRVRLWECMGTWASARAATGPGRRKTVSSEGAVDDAGQRGADGDASATGAISCSISSYSSAATFISLMCGSIAREKIEN